MKSSYRPEIDGLRAIAVLAVVLFHARLGVPGGYVGVDVFFVISGYLITGLIVADLDRGEFSLTGFWVRRVRRILPALVALVLGVLALGWFILLPGDYAALGKAAVWQSFFAANFYAWMDTGYFVPAADQKPLLHLWSLAVEEQFYLVVPILMLALYRSAALRKRGVWLALAGAGIAASLVFSAYAVAFHRGVAFYMLPSRAWELALGSFVALLPARAIPSRPALREGLCLLGLGGILFASFGYSEETPFPGLAAIPPCLGTAMFIAGSALGEKSGNFPVAAKFLAWRPVVFVGLVSYSFYLWHWPLFAFANYWAFRPLPRELRVALVLVGFVLAILSWRFVERPFRRKKGASPRALIFAAASLASVALAGGIVMKGGGFPSRAIAAAESHKNANTKSPWFRDYAAEDVRAGTLPRMGNGDPAVPVTAVLWGDSHAMAAAPAIDEYLKSRNLAGVMAARSSTPPLPETYWPSRYTDESQAKDFNAAVFDYIEGRKIDRVFLASAWTGYPGESGGKPIAGHLLELAEKLRARGVDVTILLQVPSHKVNVPRLLALSRILNMDLSSQMSRPDGAVPLPGGDGSTVRALETMGCHVVDPRPRFLDPSGSRYVGEFGDICLYRDTDHLTPEGAKLIWLPILQQPANRP